MDISVLEENIGYTFKKKKYLQEALTHSSYANDNQKKFNNERMEFLGDAVLSFVSAEYLYERYPDMAEGELSKLRSSLVCTQSLSNFAREINLGDFLLLGRGELKTGGSDRDSNLENAFEALIAAIYLDGGIEPAKKHILNFIIPEIKAQSKKPVKDYKTTLQEIVQQNPGEILEYHMVSESGPDHDKHFVFEVHLNSNVIGKGGGRSKKEAEQNAAREALELMGY